MCKGDEKIDQSTGQVLFAVGCRDDRPFFAVVARRTGGQDDYVMQSFQDYIDRLGLVRTGLKCDQEPNTLDVANTLIKRCQSTNLMATATPKMLEREFGA